MVHKHLHDMTTKGIIGLVPFSYCKKKTKTAISLVMYTYNFCSRNEQLTMQCLAQGYTDNIDKRRGCLGTYREGLSPGLSPLHKSGCV